MSAGPIPLDLEAARERRSRDRRAPRRTLDPLFAATLVSQFAPPEAPSAGGYDRARELARTGLVADVRA